MSVSVVRSGTELPPEPEYRRISPAQRACAYGLGAALLFAGLLLTPFASTPMLPLPGYMAAFGTAMLIMNGLLAALLFSRGASEQTPSTARLGTAYFFITIIFLPLIAAFPTSNTLGSIIGNGHSAVWLWSFWHAGFGVGVLRYASSARAGTRAPVALVPEIAGAIVAAAALTWLAVAGLKFLPSVMSAEGVFFAGSAQLIPWMLLAIDAAALIAVVRLKHGTPEQLWLAVAMTAACFDVWLTFHGAARYSLGWYLAKGGSIFTTLVVLLSVFHDITRVYRQASITNAVLQKLAHHDGLTGVANRRRLDAVLHMEWRRAERVQQPISLLMIDIDHFKSYNDLYGHIGGDDCLRQVADAIQRCVHRPADLMARYGGEEFAVLLPATPASGAADLANRICREIPALRIPHAASDAGVVTLSIGVATIVPQRGEPDSTLLRRADEALYAAKASGRNCLKAA